ncbi:MAG: hypothetical protein BLM47_07540 [Candidatus Reconcilbacillus cellulovorans]|uniref:NADH:quinone oxidoreductase/Mrp antiporter transmembrane domain-containing protein n=1 Tax=Candidatus Reconcilbacillus cellulovorans TaxID=1906605 RepID=A0A2A6E049_9BACL|nr:MAG: hypothetical protein BLM47_07540 [Candidatus Reconcilbacillus cellulovorans]
MTWLLLSPALGLAALALVPSESGGRVRLVGTLGTLPPLALAVWYYVAGVPRETETATWFRMPLGGGPTLELTYRLGWDGITAALVLLTAIVSTAAALAGWNVKKRRKTFYALLLTLEIGLLGAFVARDLALFFLFFELALVPTFFLIGIWGRRERERAANRFLIYNGLGSALMLIAFGLVAAVAAGNAGAAVVTTDFERVAQGLAASGAGEALRWTAFALLAAGFGIKMPVFPLHTWMLKVHAEAHPAVVMMHAGLLLKLGAYGILRFGFSLFAAEFETSAPVVAALGAIGLLYGALIALRQTELRLVLAYSSLSHMGMTLIGMAALNETGVRGAVFQMVSHGLVAAILFLIVGCLAERTQTTDLADLGGLAKPVPFIGGMWMLGGLAALGLPGLSGFVGELLVLAGAFGPLPWAAVAGLVGIVLAAVYMLRAVMGVTFGPLPERFESLRDARFEEALPAVALAAFIVLLGVYPSVLESTVRPAVEHLMRGFGG